MKTLFKKSILLLIFGLTFSPCLVFAQETMSLTLTPPLFRLSLTPGESWASSIKLVNVNDYDLTVYSSTMDFTDNGGKGTPQFLPVVSDGKNTHSLASWITLSGGPILVPAGSTKDIPFSVHIPEGAEPGGHYGAIQVGTVPVTEKGASGVAVGSQVTSLLFVRVSGAVTEEGAVRDFYAQERFVGMAKNAFTLLFENTGNVHLQPQGEIVISNMWNKERGRIPINKDSNFGNVLPQSTRDFQFVWNGEENIFDIGLYHASVSISYGEEGKQSLYRTTTFWIIPWKPVLGVLGGFALILFVIIWSVRRYIFQAIDLERRRLGFHAPVDIRPTPRVVAAPLGKSMSDLTRLSERRSQQAGLRFMTFGEYLWRYRFALISLLAFLLLGYGLYAYFTNVLTAKRAFQAEIKMPEKSIIIIANDANQ